MDTTNKTLTETLHLTASTTTGKLIEIVTDSKGIEKLRADEENMMFVDHIIDTKETQFVMLLQEGRLKYVDSSCILTTRPQLIERYKELLILEYGKIPAFRDYLPRIGELSTSKIYTHILMDNECRENGHNYYDKMSVNEYYSRLQVGARLKLQHGFYDCHGCVFDDNDAQTNIDTMVTCKVLKP